MNAKERHEQRMRDKRQRRYTIDQIKEICEKWGGVDDWNVPYVYIGTLIEKLEGLEES